MRLALTEEMRQMQETIFPYMAYTKENGWELRPDAPQEIINLKRKLNEEWERMKEEWRRENW